MKNILLVDDHSLFREGLAKLIGHWNEFRVIGEASNGAQALKMINQSPPDVILLDILMPVMNGLDVLKEISKSNLDIKVIMLTASDDDEYLFQAIKMGANGYILKNVTSTQLREMLLGVLSGEAAISGSIAAKILSAFNRETENPELKPSNEIEELSPREIEILKLIVDGYTNQRISATLFLSENTIKKYIGNIFNKLHINSRVEAAVYALRYGLVEESSPDLNNHNK